MEKFLFLWVVRVSGSKNIFITFFLFLLCPFFKVFFFLNLLLFIFQVIFFLLFFSFQGNWPIIWQQQSPFKPVGFQTHPPLLLWIPNPPLLPCGCHGNYSLRASSPAYPFLLFFFHIPSLLILPFFLPSHITLITNPCLISIIPTSSQH